MDLLLTVVAAAGFIVIVGVPFAFLGWVVGMVLSCRLKNEKYQQIIMSICAVLFFTVVIGYMFGLI